MHMAWRNYFRCLLNLHILKCWVVKFGLSQDCLVVQLPNLPRKSCKRKMQDVDIIHKSDLFLLKLKSDKFALKLELNQLNGRGFSILYNKQLTLQVNDFLSLNIFLEWVSGRLQWNPALWPPRYYNHFILAQKRLSQSFSYFKETL